MKKRSLETVDKTDPGRLSLGGRRPVSVPAGSQGALPSGQRPSAVPTGRIKFIYTTNTDRWESIIKIDLSP